MVEWNALLGHLARGRAGAVATRGVTAINVSYAALDPFTALMRFLKIGPGAAGGEQLGLLQRPGLRRAHGPALSTTFDPAAQDALLAELHAKVVDDALFLFVAHDLNPRAMSRRVQGFVQAQSWFQDLTPITMRG